MSISLFFKCKYPFLHEPKNCPRLVHYNLSNHLMVHFFSITCFRHPTPPPPQKKSALSEMPVQKLSFSNSNVPLLV